MCEVEVDLDGYSEKLVDEWRKAKKKHICGECGRTIGIGEDYEYYRGVCEEDIFSSKTCIDCFSIRDVFFASGYYFGQVLEDFYEFLNEVQGQISEECIARLTSKAQERVCNHIDELWREHWLDNPTQAAVRLEQMEKGLKFWERPGWMICRVKEMALMDSAVIGWGI